MYPKILVFLQFSLIILMLLFAKGFTAFFHHSIALPLFIMGVSVGLWALNHNKVGNFNIQPKMKYNAQLITTGIYGLIRHPMYTSVILMMAAILISSFTLIETLCFIALVIVLFLKAYREESLWIKRDITYIVYKQSTKFFIPYIL